MRQSLPTGFKQYDFVKAFQLRHPIEKVWDILLRQNTFSKTQVWPFKVEFEGESTYMREGQDNVHHGPLMLFTGVMGQIKAPFYRDLQYYMGSYFISMRLIRPARLQFTLSENPEGTFVEMKLTSYVKPWAVSFWSLMLRLFWSNFGHWLSRYISKQPVHHQEA